MYGITCSSLEARWPARQPPSIAQTALRRDVLAKVHLTQTRHHRAGSPAAETVQSLVQGTGTRQVSGKIRHRSARRLWGILARPPRQANRRPDRVAVRSVCFHLIGRATAFKAGHHQVGRRLGGHWRATEFPHRARTCAGQPRSILCGWCSPSVCFCLSPLCLAMRFWKGEQPLGLAVESTLAP